MRLVGLLVATYERKHLMIPMGTEPMTLAMTIGSYGGFYINFGYVTRNCLGWIAFDVYPREVDRIIRELTQSLKIAKGKILNK
jgi:hypothetical protein